MVKMLTSAAATTYMDIFDTLLSFLNVCGHWLLFRLPFVFGLVYFFWVVFFFALNDVSSAVPTVTELTPNQTVF